MSAVLIRSIAIVLVGVGSSFLLPIFVAWWFGESRHILDFALPLVASWVLATLFWIRGRGSRGLGGAQNAFVVVGSAWVAVSVFGSFPLYNCGGYPSFVDALFESVSGFTTTGASVLGDVESLPRCINFWRCQTHWLGGMGVIALAVALIPILGVGGYRLIQAETSGPEKGKLTARISDTAKILWLIYFILTAVQAWLLNWAGLGWFDAVCHAFSTLGTGGFSTRNASLAAFGNPAAEWICTVFMLAASVNFGLYYQFFVGRWAEIRDNTELRGFVFVVTAVVVGVTVIEWSHLGTFSTAFRYAAFQVASIVSTTGFMSNDYTTWLPSSQLLILLLFFVGGCAGSTAGGIKVIRWTVLAKELRNQVLHLLHPYGVFTLRVNGIPGKGEVVSVIASFIFVYFALVFVTAFIGALCGQDVYTAFTAALSMVGNIGPAFGKLGPSENFGAVPAVLKLWYCFAMLAGRLEVYTLLIMVGRSLNRGFSKVSD